MTAASITGFECKLIRIPLEKPAGDAIQKFDALELPCIWITDNQGRTGLGFAYTIGTGGSTITHFMREDLGPKLIGEDSRKVEAIDEKLYKSTHALTPGVIGSSARAAIDIALWDLAAKRVDLPIHILFGADKDKIPVYNTNVGWLSRKLPEMVDLCKEAVKKRGFKALKLKIGKEDPEEDRERILAVRKAVGKEVHLMVDANQSWHLDDAMRRLRYLNDLDLIWLEEPLLGTEPRSFAQLQQHCSIPLAGGESIYSLGEFFDYIASNALQILQPDLVRIGGLLNCLKVCHMADCAGLRVSPHVSPELSVVAACSVRNSMYIEYIPQMEPLLAEKIRIEDGFAFPFAGPGHGIKFDEDAIKKFEVSPSTASAV